MAVKSLSAKPTTIKLKQCFQNLVVKTSATTTTFYLTCDTLLLACVFEAFRDICNDTYGLDCAQYYGASNLSGDAFLKVCKPDLNLLTEREQLELVENTVRGGVSSIYEQRLLQASNFHLPNYDASKPSTYALMLDANNIYGGVMQNNHLLLKDFALDAHITLEEILKVFYWHGMATSLRLIVIMQPKFMKLIKITLWRRPNW